MYAGSWGKTMFILKLLRDQALIKRGVMQKRVLNVLQRGRHWVLVSLLLGNVITNETLLIVLRREVKGGWLAVFASTILIVIFGEIIPQSVCAKYGLSIGAWSYRYRITIPPGLRTNWD